MLQISSKILKEKKLIIKNIGTLKVIKKNKRYGRNSKTKQIFEIKERKSVSFTVSKNFIKKLMDNKEKLLTISELSKKLNFIDQFQKNQLIIF